MKQLLCLVIIFACPLLSGCIAGKQAQRATRVETADVKAVSQSNSPQPVDTSGVTVAWPTTVKRFEVINPAMDAAVIVAYVNTSYPPPNDQQYPALVLAVWKDGRIIRSANPIRGGPPFLQAHVPAQNVADTIQRLTLPAVESNVEPRTLHSGPDYLETTLQFRTNDDHIFEITSWHEILEEDGEYLYGRGWERVIDKESIPAIIARRTPEYREFRQVWESLRATIGELLPPNAQPVANPGFLFRNVRTREQLKRG
jgi:hypothetical protein